MLRAHLLNTVFWGLRVSKLPARRFAESSSDSQEKMRLSPALNARSRSACFLIAHDVAVPELDIGKLSEIEGEQPAYITRHFNQNARIPGGDHRLLDLVLAGSYHFGTIFRYRPADSRLSSGRLGDLQEGIQREVFGSRSGIYNAEFDGISLRNVGISGFENPVAIEYRVNDYCSCASIESFSLDRALALRSKGNEDLNYYAVYDFSKLRAAIQSILLEDSSTQHLRLISRSVSYGEKDRVWEIESGFQHQEDRDHLALWLGTVFVKPSHYEHEDEIRLILLDPVRVGNLPEDSCSISWIDARIAAAIVEHGSF